MRITRVQQANKVHLLSTLTAQQLRSDGNRSLQELTANEFHVSWAPTAVLWAVETTSDAYVPYTNKAKPKPGSAAHPAAEPGRSTASSPRSLTESAAPAADSGPCELTAPLWQGHIHELTVQNDANQDTPTPDSAAALTLRSPVAHTKFTEQISQT